MVVKKNKNARPKKNRAPRRANRLARPKTRRGANAQKGKTYRSRAVSRPAIVGVTTTISNSKPFCHLAGTEPLGSVVVQTSPATFTPGTILVDYLLNPTILSGSTSRLAASASTYASYRFTNLKLRIVSNLSTAMTGAVTWCMTRDIDSGFGGKLVGKAVLDAVKQAQCCEAALELPVWKSGALSINCSAALDRQKLYDTTPTTELDEAVQFRMLGVVSSTPGVVGTFSSAMTVNLYLDYGIDLVGQTGYNRPSPDLSYDAQDTVKITAEGLITSPLPAGQMAAYADNIYLLNPAVPCYLREKNFPISPIRGVAVLTGGAKSTAFGTPSAADANPGFPNVQGDNTEQLIPSAVTWFKVAVANKPNEQLRSKSVAYAKEQFTTSDLMKYREFLDFFSNINLSLDPQEETWMITPKGEVKKVSSQTDDEKTANKAP